MAIERNQVFNTDPGCVRQLRMKGNFAAGQRTLPVRPGVVDFARGQRSQPDPLVVGDFACGQRELADTQETEDFARGQRQAPVTTSRDSS